MSLNKKELLEKLFVWKRSTDIKDANGEVLTTVYQRIVGDFDLQAARKTALRYSREARKRIQDQSTDDYQIYIAPLIELNRADRITLCLSEEINDLKNQVESRTYIPEPKEPEGNPDLVELEQYQEADDTYEDRRNAVIQSRLQDAIAERQTELEDMSDDELNQVLIEARNNAYCDAEMRVKFIEMCAYLGTYSDEKYRQRLYANFDEFLSLPESLKQQLLEGYLSLEMNSVALKESRKTQAFVPPSSSPSNTDSD